MDTSGTAKDVIASFNRLGLEYDVVGGVRPRHWASTLVDTGQCIRLIRRSGFKSGLLSRLLLLVVRGLGL